MWSECRSLCTYALVLPRTCIVSGHDLVGGNTGSTTHDMSLTCVLTPTSQPRTVTHLASLQPPLSIWVCCASVYVFIIVVGVLPSSADWNWHSVVELEVFYEPL